VRKMSWLDGDELDICNTKQMSLQPQSPDDFAVLDGFADSDGVQLLPVYTGDAFKRLINYPVMVEMWEKAKSGRVKRAWLEQFTDAERRTVSRYYARFYRWHLVTGTPHRVSCRMKTFKVLQRAVNFFASI
jgi:hypothetical protein